MSSRCAEFDRLKGILIALVVLGHNTLFSEWSPRGFQVLYNFHVACFLLLPFLFDSRTFTLSWLTDRATRYMVPHFLFFTVATLAYLVIFVPKNAAAVMEWMQSVLLAVTLSSETAYNNATGFRIFWFLPALLTLTVLKACYFSSGRQGRRAIVGVAIAVHLGLGIVPKGWLMYVPWGLPIVLFIFPVGMATGWIYQLYRQSSLWRVASLGLFIGCIAISLEWGSRTALAGEPAVYSFLEIERLVFHDVFLLAAFFGLLLTAGILRLRILTLLGAASLVILLTHGLVWQLLVRLDFVAWVRSVSITELVAVMISYALTMATCLGLYLGLRASPRLWMTIFPRDWAAWRARISIPQ